MNFKKVLFLSLAMLLNNGLTHAIEAKIIKEEYNRSVPPYSGFRTIRYTNSSTGNWALKVIDRSYYQSNMPYSTPDDLIKQYEDLKLKYEQQPK